MKTKEQLIAELYRHREGSEGAVRAAYEDCIDLAAELEPAIDRLHLGVILGRLDTVAALVDDPAASMLLRTRDQLKEEIR